MDRVATPPTSMSTTPKTTWWMCRSPTWTFLNHHRTLARISRTLMRTATNVTMNATKKQNSGNRPVATIRCAKYSPTSAPDVSHPHHDPDPARRDHRYQVLDQVTK